MVKEILRLDPANAEGIHLVDVENGCERVYIKYKNIPNVILKLKKIYLENLGRNNHK